MQAIRRNIKSKTFLSFVSSVGISSFLVLPLISIPSAHASSSFECQVNVNTSLNVAVSSPTVSLTLNPSITPFASTDLDVTVGTNNSWGYKLYIDADGTDLTNDTYATPSYINTLDSTATGTTSSFPANKWGYRVSSLSSGNIADSSITDTTGTYFYPFTSGAMVGSNTQAVNNSTSTLTFASKADYEKPAGVYTLDFSFKAIPDVTTLSMQNLDPDVCTTTGPTLVTDSRDGQMYAIMRLADGKCWMLQNLKLGKNTDTLDLTSSDSNVPSGGFTLNNKLADGVFPLNVISDPKAPNGTAKVYDGQAYYCTESYGCYYNSYTATAGSMTSATDTGNVSYSICPKGWTLPTGGEGGEFQTLTTAYGGTNATVAANMLVSNPTTATENVNGQYAPGFLFSGAYGGDGAFGHGQYGIYYTRTSFSVGRVYIMQIGSSNVQPSRNYGKDGGYAVRCLLQEP